MRGKSTTQSERFIYAYMPIDNVRSEKATDVRQFCQRNFFITKSSKFAVECYWNDRICQNVRKLRCLKKNDVFL